jgi:hypothetical protein
VLVRNDLAAPPGLLPLIRTAQLKKHSLLDGDIQPTIIKDPPVLMERPWLAANQASRLFKGTAEHGLKRLPGAFRQSGIVCPAFERSNPAEGCAHLARVTETCSVDRGRRHGNKITNLRTDVALLANHRVDLELV